MKKRETEYDLLRLAALMGVIFTHASGVATSTAFGSSVMAFLTSTVTWHVPVFVMISGRFFLDPERAYPPKKLLRSITHIVTAFLFWNAIYQVYYILSGAYSGLNWKGILFQGLLGAYHLWFLFMLVGLYAIVPFLRKIVTDRQLTEYFLLLFLVFQGITIYGPALPVIGDLVTGIMGKFQFSFAMGFSGYFVLGYYLYRWPVTGKREIALYLAGILCFCFTGFGTVLLTLNNTPGEEWLCKYLMPNVVVEAAALFTFFTSRIKRFRFSEGFRKLISKAAQCSFGAYLIHALVLDLTEQVLPFSGLPGVVAHVLLVLTLSLGITALIRRIPLVGKQIT